MNVQDITPSNWLFNAGIVGLLRTLDTPSTPAKNFLKHDGSVDQEGVLTCLHGRLDTEKAKKLKPPFNMLSQWEWDYLNKTFEWNYVGIDFLVHSALRRAALKGSNKKQLLNQLLFGELSYEGENVDTDPLNQQITEAFSDATGRNPSKTVDNAFREITITIESNKEAFITRKAIGFLFSQNGPYQNLYNPNWFSDLKRFIEFFKFEDLVKQGNGITACIFCGANQFQTESLDAQRMSQLFPVFKKFPNAFWANDASSVTQICSLCNFVLLHHHLALTRLSDGSELFITSPSFQVMYDLNEMMVELYGGTASERVIRKREALAMTIIEYAMKRTLLMGTWSQMNIEIVIKRQDEIEHFSLPYEIVRLISDRQIATLLSDLGEFRILNLVLSEDFSRLVHIGYGLLRESLDGGDRRPTADEWLFRSTNKGPALQRTAEKILRLYALIDQKQRRTNYGRTRAAAI